MNKLQIEYVPIDSIKPYVGIYDIGTIFAIATAISIIEIIVALCDTPFLYLSKKLK